MRLKLSFQIKLFLCLVAFSCLLLSCIGAYTYYQLDAQLHRDLGARAQVQAREIALIPSLVDAVEKKRRRQDRCVDEKKSAPAATPAISSSVIIMPVISIIQNMRAAWARR